jgi:uncharacterized protein (DUF433 family)
MANRRHPTIHGLTIRAIIRYWRQGLKLRALSADYGLTEHEIAGVLTKFGDVSWVEIECRERR